MPNRILILSDHVARTLEHAKAIGTRYRSDIVDITGNPEIDDTAVMLLAVDVTLSDPDIARKLKELCGGRFETSPRLFFLNDDSRSTALQANALGSSANIVSPYDPDMLNKMIERLLAEATASAWSGMPKSQVAALNAVNQLNAKIYDAIRNAVALPKHDIVKCSDLVIASLEENGASSWLEAVRQHHVHTYRHSMNVTGMAVAYGLHLGMRHSDVQRLATGALLHDIGKLKVSSEILEAAAPVEGDRLAAYRRHPIYSSEILTRDGQFDYEVIEIALNHHEMLDGSGFPQRLQRDKISDIVRVISIMVTFSELIDPLFGDQPLSPADALSQMRNMGDKLDQDFVSAFEPVALAA